jgi:hypothetical protein
VPGDLAGRTTAIAAMSSIADSSVIGTTHCANVPFAVWTSRERSGGYRRMRRRVTARTVFKVTSAGSEMDAARPVRQASSCDNSGGPSTQAC